MAEGDAEKAKPIPFGPFMLIRRLAVGGHAEVYLARPKSGSAPAPELVIKRPLSTGNDEFVTLDREADLHRMVDHPNVVKVFGAGMVDNEPYLAMEHVDGVDAYRLLRRAEMETRTIPPGLAVYIARSIAAALGGVHSAKDRTGRPLDIVHRDVTPSNIYLSVDGEVKLGDFGIARIVEDAVVPSSSGLKGKFGYFAPEQLDGDAFDHRADLFSLTVLLGEMLIGERVFPGSGQLAVLLAIREVNVEPLRRASKKLPEGLMPVLERALSRDPAERYQNATELGAALAPFEKPSEAACRAELAEWVAWARDSSRMAQQLHGRIKDSVHRMRAVRSSSSLKALADAEPPTESDLSKIKREDGTILDAVPFPKIVEMVATGELGPDDQIDLMGAGFAAVRDVDDLARHLMPSTTQKTAQHFDIGVPDFRATLEDTPMVDVLARLRRDRETGALFAQRSETGATSRKELYLKAGRLLHVASSEREELLGEYLVRRKVVERKQLDQALGRLRTHGGRLGDTLIAMGFVEAMDVYRAIRDQGRDRVAAICAWPVGQIVLYRGSTPGHVEFPLDLDLVSPMMAGAILSSKGAPRTLLPADDARIRAGARAPGRADRLERGTAPTSMQLVASMAREEMSVGDALGRLLARRPGARAVGEKEACAALVAARALEWIEF